MRRIFVALLLALAGAGISQAQVSPIRGWCESGAQQVVLAGLNSTTQVQASFPQCTVTVSIHGDGAATIFADANSTPLGNPFTAQTNGQWIFYVASGRYDVQLSGAGFPTPITYSDIFTTGAGGATVIPGGSPIQTQVNNNGAFGGTPCESFNDILAGPENISCDWHSRGPNPYADVTAFGVRGAAAITGITATCTSGQTQVTISSASTFQKGDGVTLYGCGGANGMTTPSAPTVTPSIARTLTGVGDVVNSPTGATTYNYKILSCNKSMGCTSASVAGTTAVGLSSLGSQNVNITSMSRSGNVVTVVTSAPHGLVTNAMVYINPGNSLSDPSFAGWYQVTGSADNTHFTFTSGQTTANGGVGTASTGGIAYWFDCNFLTWTVPTGAYITYILSDRANPGTFAIVGVAKPVNGSFTDGTAYWEDYGAAMEGNVSFGPGNTIARWLPAAPFSSATNNALTTTIASGAGTTILTLNAAAGNTLSGTPIQFDDGPNLVTALTNSLGKPVYIPLGVVPIINSITDLSTINPTFTLTVVGGLNINETLIVGSGTKFLGDPMPQTGSLAQFQLEGYPVITCTAIPCLHNIEGAGFIVRGLQFKSNVNQMIQVLSDGGGFAQGGSNFDRNAFIGIQGGGGTQDQMSILLYLRGRPSQESAGAHIGRMNLAVNPISNNNGLTATPGAYCFDCGFVHVETFLFQQLRGWAIRPDPAGSHIVVRGGYSQGGVTPMFALLGAFSAISTGVSIDVQNFNQDTDPHPLIIYLPSVGTLAVTATLSGAINGASSGVPLVSGNAFSVLTSLSGTVSGQNTGAQATFADTNSNTLQQNLTDTSLLVVGNGEFGYALPVPASPTIAVAAGTSNPVGTYTVKIMWVDVNGKATGSNGLAGVIGGSAASNSAVLTTNNQNINLTPPVAPAAAIGYYMFYSVGGGSFAGPMPVGAGGCASVLVSPVAPANDIRATNCATIISPGAASSAIAAAGVTAQSLVLSGRTITSVQGTDSKIMSAGTVSGASVLLCTDANGGATTSGCPSAGTFYQTVDANAVAQTQRPTLNLISGTNATVSCADNAGATRTDCTFAANANTLWSSITAATNANPGTFAATGNTWDFSGATSFKVPVAGGAAPTADGTIADNSTTHGLNFGSNGNTLNAAVASTGAGGTGTTCAANSAVTALSNTAAPTCTQLIGGGLPYTNWGVNSSCTQTGSGAGATQTCTISFNTTEANTSYKIVCGGTGTITGYPFMQGVITKNTTNAVVQYTNGTSNEAVVSGWANIECILTR